jgi:hypothetical protein
MEEVDHIFWSNLHTFDLGKFDQREGFYSDALFFCLMETAEYIGLLIPNIGINEGENKNITISKIQKNISI